MASCSDVLPSFKDLFEQVHVVLEWYTLGLHLGVPIERLNVIDHSSRELGKKQMDMLDYWMRNLSGTWKDLGDALLKMEAYSWLGRNILQKYCYNSLYQPQTSLATSSNKPPEQEEARPFPKHLLPFHHHHPPSTAPSLHHNSQMIPRSGGRPVSGGDMSLYIGQQQAPPYQHPSMTPPVNRFTPPYLPGSSLPLPMSRFPTQLDHRRSIELGEMVVDTRNPSLASSHAHSLNDPNPSGAPISIVAYDSNGQQWQLSDSNLLNFLRFDPSPNTIQSPTSSFSSNLGSNRSQEVPNTNPTTSIPKEQVVETELRDFCFKFNNLIVLTREALTKAKVRGEKLKQYLCDILCGASCFKTVKPLKTELSRIPDSPTVNQVFEVLLNFLSYDCPRVLKLLIENFLPKSDLENRVTKYETEFKNFQLWCSMGSVADVHPRIYPPDDHHFSDTSVAMHLNDNWQEQKYSELNTLRDREFHHVEPNISFRIVHAEKRSILVVWETSYSVVNQLSIDCAERFRHLGSQGVLQLLIGRYLLDYTIVGMRKPRLYKLEVANVIERDRLPPSPSMMSLMSTGTNDTHWSGKTGGVSQATSHDSGHYSCDTTASSSSRTRHAPSKLTPYSDRMLQKCPLKQVQVSYENPSKERTVLKVRKGEQVRVMYEGNDWAEVVDAHKRHGYIPSYVLMDSNSMYTSRQSIINDTAMYYSLVLHEITDTSHDQSHDQSHDDVSLESPPTEVKDAPARPDTPPLVWQMHADNVRLSEEHNTMMRESSLELSDDDIMSTQQQHRSERRSLKHFIKEIETLSLTKSLRSEWNRLKRENDVPKTISFVQKLKNLVQPQRKISSNSGQTPSEIDNSPVDDPRHDWYMGSLSNEHNSSARFV